MTQSADSVRDAIARAWTGTSLRSREREQQNDSSGAQQP